MIQKFTRTNVNIRSGPTTDADNIITLLRVATPVELLDEFNDTSDFVRVRAMPVGAAAVEGFVSAGFLRDRASELKEALIARAVAEWARFGFGDGQESLPPFAGFVGEYWKAINIDLDGTNTETPWSAAYISFIVRRAGYGASFPYAEAHATYIRDAIKKRKNGDDSAAFWGFGLNEQRPALGDLLAGWRENKLTFGTVPDDFFPSHCDVVVGMKGNVVQTLGGNVSNSVSLKTFTLNADGFLISQAKLFALLRNNR